MEICSARSSERDVVLDLLARWYDNREFFARYNQNDPAFRNELCLVARDAGRIASAQKIAARSIPNRVTASPFPLCSSRIRLTIRSLNSALRTDAR